MQGYYVPQTPVIHANLQRFTRPQIFDTINECDKKRTSSESFGKAKSMLMIIAARKALDTMQGVRVCH